MRETLEFFMSPFGMLSGQDVSGVLSRYGDWHAYAFKTIHVRPVFLASMALTSHPHRGFCSTLQKSEWEPPLDQRIGACHLPGI